ncbi:glycoside hydrolase family 32 protein [Paenibacillus sp. 19GGS1-52]|uniref:glycoside hydrolase family 32 protein n=1 Tax=Paenibacillus sp. 19GGS1-52 TaxID=2758563 RepID=UPI001EFB3E5D|nr:glycoside hydrolase family 32 protein [Paenibacillus sp. 19GGS1-52]ULO05782.1 glycoside hydrolase family 32 protein [Paenibacillus sp. 19GGS1-52]
MNVSGEKQQHKESIRLADEAVAAAAKIVAQDDYRLQYHVMPEAGWMNDPNGLIYFKGEYHLFYQHHPYSDKWGPMHWGHVTSKDLLHWKHLPIALAPTEPYELGQSGGYGCWSGSAIEQDGVLTLIYTGHVDGRQPMEVQCAATSVDGITFDKHPANPLIAVSPDEGNTGFRDPKVWRHGELWYMVIGSGREGKGQALLYRSADLEEWAYMGVAAESDGTHGDMWECPDLFPLGDKHVLVLSPMNMEGAKNLYMVGEMDYESGKFTPEQEAMLDHGPDFYAAQTLLDNQGRRIMIAWMDHWGAEMAREDRGWYGAMTVPRELVLMLDGKLASRPVPELELLREEGIMVSGVTLAAGESAVWSLKNGQGCEWIVEFDLEGIQAKLLELSLLVSEDGQERTVIRYLPSERKLLLDCCTSGAGDTSISAVTLPETSSTLKLQVFVDRSSIEVFVNDGQYALTSRVYPTALRGGLTMKAEGGSVSLQSLHMWNLKSIGS